MSYLKPSGFLVQQVFQELSYGFHNKHQVEDVFELLHDEVEEPKVKRLLRNIQLETKRGRSLGLAIDRVVRDKSRFLDQLLGHCSPNGYASAFATAEMFMKRKNQESMLKPPWRSSFTPMLVVFVVVFFVLNVFVVPQFNEVFAAFGADLPALTLFAIKLSEVFLQYWWLILFAFIVLRFIFSLEVIRLRIDRFVLLIPGIGRSVRARELNEFIYRCLALLKIRELKQEDIPGISASAVHNLYLRQLLSSQSPDKSLFSWLKNVTLVPSRVRRMLAMPGSEEKLFDLLEKQVDTQLYWLSSQQMTGNSMAIFTLQIMFYLMIGTFIIAMYLPIFQLGSVV